MSRTRSIFDPSTSPFRAVTAEPLEGRRLLAATAMRPQFNVSHADYGQHGPSGEAATFMDAGQSSQYGYGQRPVSLFGIAMAIARFEAYRAAETAALSPASPVNDAPAPTSIPVSAPSSVSSPSPVANAVTVNHIPAPQAVAGQQDGVDSQFMAADNSTDIPVAAITTAQAAATAATDRVFGPFNVQDTTTNAAPAQTGSGLMNLLNPNSDAVDKALRWQAQDTTYRPRRAAEPGSTADAEGTLPTITVEQATQQASILPIVTPLGANPIWQRLALMTAGATFVVGNWIVRRRREKLSMNAIVRR